MEVTLTVQDLLTEVCLKENDSTTSKVINTGDLKNLFLRESGYDSGDLPLAGNNTIGIKRIISSGNDYYVFVNCLNIFRDIKYGHGSTNTYKRVPLPNLMFAFRLSKKGTKYKITNSNCRTHVGYISSASDRMCHFPFGNVYGNGSICWGSSIRLGTVELTTFNQLIGVVESFLSSNYNSDLYNGPTSIRPPLTGGGLERFIASLSKASIEMNLEAFPSELVTMKGYGTYGEYVRGFTGGRSD